MAHNVAKRRFKIALVLGVVGSLATLVIHFARLYDASVFSDSVAHFGAGIGLGAAVYLSFRRWSRYHGRMIDAFAIAFILIVAMAWEVAEATFVPFAGLDVHGWDDTIKDVALVVLGGAATVWATVRYRSPKTD